MRHAAVYEEDDLADNGAELSLGMGTLIGIFFGLALVCGVFFGFGYMMGHRTPGPYVSSEPLYDAPKPAETPVAPKPSALVPEQPSDASRVVLPATSQTTVAGTTTTCTGPTSRFAAGHRRARWKLLNRLSFRRPRRLRSPAPTPTQPVQ